MQAESLRATIPLTLSLRGKHGKSFETHFRRCDNHNNFIICGSCGSMSQDQWWRLASRLASRLALASFSCLERLPRISRALLERLQLDFMRVSIGVPGRTCVSSGNVRRQHRIHEAEALDLLAR